MKPQFKIGKHIFNINLNEKALIFSFFLCISTLFWILIKLSDNYVTNITYPVVYINLPENKLNTNELPKKLTLKVGAKGFDILKYKLSSDFIPIKLDMNSLEVEYFNSDSNYTFLITQNLLKDIKLQFSERQMIQNIDIIKINPDTIFFEYISIVNKKVPVGLNADITFFKQYMLKDKIIIIPDSVTISGPAKYLDTINYVNTEFLLIKDLNEKYLSEVKLTQNKKITYSTDKVIVDINVEEFTEQKIVVPIMIINVPDSLTLKIFPNEININYLVGLSFYNKIDNGNFEVYVDFNDIKKSFTQKLKVKVNNYPSQIKSFKYSPISVEYLIEK